MRELHSEEIKGLKIICDKLEKDVNMTFTLSMIGYPDLCVVKNNNETFSIYYSDEKRPRNYYYFINTLMLLEKDGEVLFLDNDIQPINQVEHATGFMSKNRNIKDESITFFLNKNWNKTIIVSNALLEYVNKGKTAEQIRFRKNIIATWTGIIIAFFIGIAGVVLNIIGLCNFAK